MKKKHLKLSWLTLFIHLCQIFGEKTKQTGLTGTQCPQGYWIVFLKLDAIGVWYCSFYGIRLLGTLWARIQKLDSGYSRAQETVGLHAICG